MSKRKIIPVVLACVASLLAGCRVIAVGVVTVAAAVGLTGYAVYKTGDAVVTGAGTAVRATGDTFSSGTKSAATVIFANGEFKTEYAQDVQTVWDAANRALQKAKFENVRGSFDALSGDLTARTINDTEIVIKLKSLGVQATEARIRVGIKGDIRRSEIIHGMIMRELPAPADPQPAAISKEEVKP